MIEIKTNKIAGGGVFSALCIGMLICAAYVPNVMLAFLFASSILMGICILRYKTLCAMMTYLVSSIITVFFIPDIALYFFALFGIYPILKLYIEKIRIIWIEYLLKIVLWNLFIVIMYIVLSAIGQIQIWDINIILLWIIGIAALLFYDFMFTVVINMFYKTYYKYIR